MILILFNTKLKASNCMKPSILGCLTLVLSYLDLWGTIFPSKGKLLQHCISLRGAGEVFPGRKPTAAAERRGIALHRFEPIWKGAD